MTGPELAGWSALLAAIATVVGAVTLMVFFARGGLWGLANDIASIVLMLATIPVAIAVAQVEAADHAMLAPIALIVGIGGMLLATAAQGLLVTRVRTYEQLLPWTLSGGAIVGIWYLLIGVLGSHALGTPLASLAIAAGIGFIGIGFGFARGGQRDPIAAGSGLVLFLASTTFLTWLGVDLLGGRLAIPVTSL